MAINVSSINLVLPQTNILINNEAPPRACISDFGLSAVVLSISFGPTTSRAGAGGTLGYIAPELFSEGAEASKEADIYAFGMVVYEVITGTRPFGRRRVIELPLHTARGGRPIRPEDPEAVGFGQGTWEFTERCWDGSQERRPTAREALEHFERVAKTSMVVKPGPTIPGHGAADEEPSKSDSTSNYCERRGHHTVSPL